MDRIYFTKPSDSILHKMQNNKVEQISTNFTAESIVAPTLNTFFLLQKDHEPLIVFGDLNQKGIHLYYVKSKIYEKIPVYWNHYAIATEYDSKTDQIIWMDSIADKNLHLIYRINRKTLTAFHIAAHPDKNSGGIALNKEGILYYAAGQYISYHHINKKPDKPSKKFDDLTNVKAIAIDEQNNYLYLVDSPVSSIHRSSITNNLLSHSDTKILSDGLATVSGLVFGSERNIFYFTNTLNSSPVIGKIEKYNLNDSSRSVIFEKAHWNIYGITKNPIAEELYFSVTDKPDNTISAIQVLKIPENLNEGLDSLKLGQFKDVRGIVCGLTPEVDSENDENETKSSKNNAGLIGGVVSAAVIVLLITIAITIYCLKKKPLKPNERAVAYAQSVASGGNDNVTVITSVTGISGISQTHDYKGAAQFGYVKMPSDEASVSGRSIKY
ncbi:DgyrCDS2342 [Dimorphilus gyrociliatus]|uniref:DgyrCDS2342 n=1 Tax=Dimorphilus gyrociliatus TaxID=2664684 RepID=A0A7I8VA87_9ANNE|nr:DgyrCDS2342 [Dimorphilus gyrociliatus]